MGVLVTLMNAAGIVTAVSRYQEFRVREMGTFVMPLTMNFCLFAVLSLFPFYITRLCGTGDRKIVRVLRNASVPVSAVTFACYCGHVIAGKRGSANILVLPEVAEPSVWYTFSCLGCFMILTLCFVIVCISVRKTSGRQTVALIMFMVFPVLASFLTQYHRNMMLIPSAMTLSLLTIHNYIQHDQVLRLQEQETRLANHRIQLMISQIRPHFIFNTLNTIYYLCEKDPAEAQRAIDDFSEYLRANLETLENEKEVSFSREIEYVRHYLSLEKMRFGDELRTEFDLQADHFGIPPMTVQPIVENAVKHGLMKKDGGGTVLIASREKEDCYEVTVTDDGTGFDPSREPQGDDKKHVGIRNVRERLERISGGELTIRSAPGKGTRAVIRLPKEPRGQKAG